MKTLAFLIDAIDNSKELIRYAALLGKDINAKANLIVVLKVNRNFFERLFKSSFTAELVENTQLPIMVYKRGSRKSLKE